MVQGKVRPPDKIYIFINRQQNTIFFIPLQENQFFPIYIIPLYGGNQDL